MKTVTNKFYTTFFLLAAVLTLSLQSTSKAEVFNWERYDIAVEIPEGGSMPFRFFDPSSIEIDWDEMVLTMQHYLKNDNTNKKNLEERLKSMTVGYNMYDTKMLNLKVKGFQCHSIEGTMPDGTRCIISYLVSDKTTTVIEVVINYLYGNQEVAEDIIKSISEGNDKKPNEREKPKQKVQKKKDAEKQKKELEKEKKRKNEKVYEC